MSGITTVELVYPHGPGVACPGAIGRHLAAELSGDYEVRLHDFDSFGSLAPRGDAALVGHAHPAPGRLFARSARAPGWGRVVLLQPFVHDFRQVGYLRNVVPSCDRFLAICGPYWTEDLGGTPFAPWAPSITQVDLAVDTADFPRLRSHSSAPGGRRFLFVGSNDAYKNLGYLDAIAGELSEFEFSWIGSGRSRRANLRRLGYQDLGADSSRELVSGFDFLITVGNADANPATIVEAMAWGLVPVCTRQSGWGEPGRFCFLPLDDVHGAAEELRRLQYRPSAALDEIRLHNWQMIESHYCWPRFADQVRGAIEGEPVRVPQLHWRTRAAMALGHATGPLSMLHPRTWVRWLRASRARLRSKE